MSKNKTAILIFTRTEAQEAKHKNWGTNLGKGGTRKIAKSLIKHTISTAKKTDLPVFTCFGDEQYGKSFGEKLANAIEDVFAKGFGNIIAIGNDSPNLSSDLILQSKQLLEQNKVVIGPSKDGGIYLLGLNKEAYSRQEFIQLKWQSKFLSADWKQYIFTVNLTLFLLPEFLDIDDEKSLSLFLNRRQRSFLKKLIEKIIAGFHSIAINTNQKKQSIYVIRLFQLRAPPTLF